MRKVILPKIQGFYLTIILKDNILILRMEEESSERTFSVTLDSNSVFQMTFGLFEKAEQLAKGLEDAVNRSECGLCLSLFPGRLIYNVHFPEGVPEESFTIDLTEIGETSKINKRFDKLEDMVGQMEKKMNQMAERLENSFQILQRLCAPDLYFSNNSRYHGFYSFSDNNKTVRLKLEFDPWIDPLEIFPQVPSRGQHSYSVRINNSKEEISFGIAVIEKKMQGITHHHIEYKYSTRNGEISGKINKRPGGKAPYGSIGDMIKLCIDIEKGILSFFVNNREVNNCEIEKEYKYLAHIYLRNQGDCATLC